MTAVAEGGLHTVPYRATACLKVRDLHLQLASNCAATNCPFNSLVKKRLGVVGIDCKVVATFFCRREQPMRNDGGETFRCTTLQRQVQ
jgi:hypothetical protein